MIEKVMPAEVFAVKSAIRYADSRIATIHSKILMNLEYEKAGATLPYDYTKLHEEAEAIRAEAKAAPQELSDEVASHMPSLFPTLGGNGELVKAGTKINWNETIKKAAVDLWDIETNNPDNAPTLWEDLLYIAGDRVIPEVITATGAFNKGELGWWNGTRYESLIDANVWNPTQYADGWREIKEDEE